MCWVPSRKATGSVQAGARLGSPGGDGEPAPTEGPAQLGCLTHGATGSEVFFGGKRRDVGEPESGKRSGPIHLDQQVVGHADRVYLAARADTQMKDGLGP